jgi:uncharacterized repeat protein (TIGR02543 family)
MMKRLGCLYVCPVAAAISILVLLPISARADAGAFASDDFNSFNLDTGLWTFVDPVGDATLAMMGTNTQDAWVSISVPAGTSHDVWAAGNQAPRIMQPADDTDFEIEAKFESGLSQKYQMQGIIVEQDSDDFLRFDFYSDDVSTKVFAASFTNGAPLQRANSVITNTGVAPLYMRVKREGDEWMQSYSYDGASWITSASFTHALSVTSVGTFVANAGDLPTHTGTIDYFFNSASPVNPEDGAVVEDDTPPLIYNVQDVAGQTQLWVNWSTDEPATGVVQYGETTDYELGSVSHAGLTLHHTVLITDLQPDTTYNFAVISEDSYSNQSVSDNFVVVTDPPGTLPDPDIVVWYGSEQAFGHIGLPQRWVNILGNVSDPDAIASLTYSLNGGPELPLSIGPDGYRLAAAGDFNVEIDHSNLFSGTNIVLITATDILDNTTIAQVNVEYTSGNTWPQVYSIDWSSVENIPDVAQVVDGLWTVEGDHIRPVGANENTYDRLVAIGDVSWLDYEVTVPITIHQFFGSDPGVGILVRWNGHGEDGYQPHRDPPFGGLGWFRYPYASTGRLSIMGNGLSDIARDYSGRQLDVEVPYIFKMRVETELDGDSLYSFKVWEASDPEPSTWDLTGYGNDIDPDEAHGSMLLVAHRTDASFGDVTIVPGDGVWKTLTVNTVGDGSVIVQPYQPAYVVGQVVTLTATADPGWTFAGWSGALSGTDNPETTTITDHTTVTATFTQEEYTLAVNTIGSGSVISEPVQATYHYGDVVTLTASADPGWTFAGWSGDLISANNPTTITMDSDKTVTATFVRLGEYTLTVNVIGGGTVDKDPDQPTYSYGDVVTLTASADPGWIFAEWSGDLSGTENPEIITITGHTTVTATFTSQIFLPFITSRWSP